MNYEIVVVGASTAGLYSAELLARQGKQVAVVERVPEIDPEERTYIITPGLYQVMKDIPAGLIQQEIDRFQIQSGQKQADIHLSAPDLIIDRAALISTLASRAKTAGVVFLNNHEFIGFDSSEGRTLIKLKKEGAVERVSARYLIGADGVNSAVRNSLGLDPVPAVPLLQAVVDQPEGWNPQITKVWFDVENTPYFFWLIPKDGNQAVVGLIAEQGADIQSLLDGFMAAQNFNPVSFQSGQAALHNRNAPTYFTVGNLPVMLVGDAAGQVKVTTVGGTVTGFGGALDAVGRILGTKNNHVKRELDLHHYIRRLLDQMEAKDYEDLIDMLNPAVTNFLSVHDRDNMRSHFWKLTLLQPRFIPLGLKLLSRAIWNGRSSSPQTTRAN